MGPQADTFTDMPHIDEGVNELKWGHEDADRKWGSPAVMDVLKPTNTNGNLLLVTLWNHTVYPRRDFTRDCHEYDTWAIFQQYDVVRMLWLNVSDLQWIAVMFTSRTKEIWMTIRLIRVVTRRTILTQPSHHHCMVFVPGPYCLNGVMRMTYPTVLSHFELVFVPFEPRFYRTLSLEFIPFWLRLCSILASTLSHSEPRFHRIWTSNLFVPLWPRHIRFTGETHLGSGWESYHSYKVGRVMCRKHPNQWHPVFPTEHYADPRYQRTRPGQVHRYVLRTWYHDNSRIDHCTLPEDIPDKVLPCPKTTCTRSRQVIDHKQGTFQVDEWRGRLNKVSRPRRMKILQRRHYDDHRSLSVYNPKERNEESLHSSTSRGQCRTKTIA